MRTRVQLRKFAFVLLGVTLVAPLFAQNPNGSLCGTVRDASQAVVAAATVSVRNSELSFSRETESDARGEFRIVIGHGIIDVHER